MTALTVLSTRPDPMSDALLKRLTALGYRALSAPMLHPERLRRIELSMLSDMDGVVFTSPMAARLMLEDLAGRKAGIPAYCVGLSTSGLAREAGFENSISAGAGAEALVDLIATTTPKASRLLWPRSRSIAVDIEKALGSRISSVIYYRMNAVECLPDAARGAIESGQLEAVLLTSVRAAATFLAVTAHLDLSRVTAICFSKPIGAQLPPERFRRLLSAAHPTQESMLERLTATIPP